LLDVRLFTIAGLPDGMISNLSLCLTNPISCCVRHSQGCRVSFYSFDRKCTARLILNIDKSHWVSHLPRWCGLRKTFCICIFKYRLTFDLYADFTVKLVKFTSLITYPLRNCYNKNCDVIKLLLIYALAKINILFILISLSS